MKKIIVVILCVILVFFIYIFTKDDKVLYFKVSDYTNNKYDEKVIDYLDNKKKLENYVIYKNLDNYRIVDLINDIKNNKEIKKDGKNYSINNLLVKSELIILDIGHNDFLYCKLKNNDMYDYINEILVDFDNLFNLIRKYTKENIIVVFDYNIEQEYKDYLYERLLLKADKYNIKIVLSDKIMKYVKNIY